MAEKPLTIHYDKSHLLDVKSDIKECLMLIEQSKDFINKSDLVSIIKAILFFKKISIYFIERDGFSHYKDCFIYDCLALLNSLTRNSVRGFYYEYRSMIENFVRYILNLSDDDEKGVRKIFNNLEKAVKEVENEETATNIFTHLKGEYGICCNFIHSNKKAKEKIYIYYKDLLGRDEMNMHMVNKLMTKYQQTIKKMINIYILCCSTIVDSVFYRHRTELKYLIGLNSYTLFLQQIKEE